jgi:hypothetical protein
MRARCGCARSVCALLAACGFLDGVAWGQEAYRVFPVRQVTTGIIDLDKGRMGINNRGEIAFTDFDKNRAYVWLPAPNEDYVPAVSACEGGGGEEAPIAGGGRPAAGALSPRGDGAGAG